VQQHDSPVYINPESQSSGLVTILVVLAGQLRGAMEATHAPMAILVNTAHELGKITEVLASSVMDFSDQPKRVFNDLMTLHGELHVKSTAAVTAVQFHDRHIQMLTHVCSSLSFIADAMLRNQGSLSAADWGELSARIRSMLSMEQERALFDRSAQGGTAAADPSATPAMPAVDIF